MAKSEPVIPLERIAGRIYLIRGEKVMLDSDLAELYGVTTGNLNKAVKRNPERFPEDFIFQLTAQETESLLFQTGRAKPSGRGGRHTPPHAFTEQGVAMLSTVLRSKRAVQVNISIMRTFVKLRQMLATNRELARKVAQHDRQIAVLFDEVRKLLAPVPRPSLPSQREKPDRIHPPRGLIPQPPLTSSF
ncbi:MAG TPA: ORF6N domain-containing protein [Candidatus Binataceae bacterium]|nr:ORF6N domain-containing protein [Candidatus Binataceae bacterium]